MNANRYAGFPTMLRRTTRGWVFCRSYVQSETDAVPIPALLSGGDTQNIDDTSFRSRENHTGPKYRPELDGNDDAQWSDNPSFTRMSRCLRLLIG